MSSVVPKGSLQTMEDELPNKARVEEAIDQARVVQAVPWGQISTLPRVVSIPEAVENDPVDSGSSVTPSQVLINETARLLPQGPATGLAYVVSDPKRWVIDRTEHAAFVFAAPLLSRLSAAERIAENYNYKHNWAMGLFLESFLLFFNTTKMLLPNIHS